MQRSHFSRHATLAVAAALCSGIAAAAHAETRTYVVSEWNLANYSHAGDCGADGKINPMAADIFPPQLKAAGLSDKEIEKIMSEFNGGNASDATREALVFRGRINGKPVNVYNYPQSVPDPKLRTIIGTSAYGFNLDGKVETGGFEELETHEKGIDNQLFRAIGCISTEREASEEIGPGRPVDTGNSAFEWNLLRSATPAWIMTITGQDLSKDGDVLVTFDKSMDHMWMDGAGVMRDKTYRLDNNPRWHNEFKATLKNHVVTSLEPTNFLMDGDSNYFTQYDLHKAHLRFTMMPNGSIDGTLGGYVPWVDAVFYYTNFAYFKETMQGIDMPGAYYAIKRLADAEPDPRTGINMRISSAWRVQAVPAYMSKEPVVVRSLRAAEGR